MRRASLGNAAVAAPSRDCRIKQDSVVVTNMIRLRFHRRSTPIRLQFDRAIRPFYVTPYRFWAAALRTKQEFVRPRWPYDMRPSVRAEKYIRDAGP